MPSCKIKPVERRLCDYLQVNLQVLTDNNLGNGATGRVYRHEKPGGGYEAVKIVPLIDIYNGSDAERKRRHAKYQESAVREIKRIRLKIGNDGDIKYLVKTNGVEHNKIYDDSGNEVGMDILFYMELLSSYGDNWGVEGSLDLKTFLKLSREICKAMRLLHSNGFVHRDVREPNIFYDEEKDVFQLGDFDCFRLLPEEDDGFELSKATGMSGDWLAPEYYSPANYDLEVYDNRVDIYSFGVTLDHLNERRGDEKVRNNAALQTVIKKAKEKDPRDRWQTADEMLKALEEISE